MNTASELVSVPKNEPGPNTPSASDPVSAATPYKIDYQTSEASPGTSKSYATPGTSRTYSSPTATINTKSNQGSPNSLGDFGISLEPRTIQRIHHALFKWTIQDFSRFPDVNDEYCLSPNFALHDTYWALALHPKAKIHGVDKISLNLIRRKAERGPKLVNASYRLGLECHDNKVWFEEILNILFAEGDCYGFQTSVLGNLEDFVSNGLRKNDDSISVLCELYFKYEKREWRREPRGRTFGSDLQLNMLSLYKSGTSSDMIIECSSYRRGAHKAILAARSRTLDRLLEDGKSSVRLQTRCTSLNFVLLYMYTGSLTWVVKEGTFSIGSYELARDLFLHRLGDLLEPNKIEMMSRIVDEETTFAWTLLQFHVADLFEGDLFSDCYVEPATKISIQLVVKKITDKDHIDIFVRVFCWDALRRVLEVYLWNKEVTPFEKVPAVFYNAKFERSELSFVVRFSVIDVLYCSLFDGNRLSVHFRFERLSIKPLPHLNYHRLVKTQDNLEDEWQRALCVAMSRLWMRGTLSDVTLVVSDWTFETHRCMLAARSNHFAKLFANYRDRKITLVGNEIEPLVMFVILMFVYTDKITKFPLENVTTKMDALKIYEFAEIFRMTPLKGFYEKLLCSNLDPDIAQLMLPVALRLKNANMINACLDYLKKLQVSQITTRQISFTSDDNSDEDDDEAKGADTKRPPEPPSP